MRWMICIVVMLAAMASPQAWSFWRIWENVEQPPQAMDLEPLRPLREGECGDPATATQTFGETTYMRGEIAKEQLPEPFQQAVAAAYVAETIETARELLDPLLDDTAAEVRAAARVALAYILLRRESRDGESAAAVMELLRGEPNLEKLSDYHYLRAVLALYARNWHDVRTNAAWALELAPRFYNAQVLASLAELEEIDRAYYPARSCDHTIDALATALVPLMRLGACPTHVGHFDETARRYLSHEARSDHRELTLLRRIMLAYVSRNDELRGELLNAYSQEEPHNSKCFASVGKFDFGRQ